MSAIHTRVKIDIAGSDKAKYAYVTTGDGMPVITIGSTAADPEGLAAMGGTVVTADKALASDLGGLGYSVRISDPQSKYQREKRDEKTLGTKLSKAECAEFESLCARSGTTVNAAIKAAVLRMIKSGSVTKD